MPDVFVRIDSGSRHVKSFGLRDSSIRFPGGSPGTPLPDFQALSSEFEKFSGGDIQRLGTKDLGPGTSGSGQPGAWGEGFPLAASK